MQQNLCQNVHQSFLFLYAKLHCLILRPRSHRRCETASPDKVRTGESLSKNLKIKFALLAVVLPNSAVRSPQDPQAPPGHPSTPPALSGGECDTGQGFVRLHTSVYLLCPTSQCSRGACQFASLPKNRCVYLFLGKDANSWTKSSGFTDPAIFRSEG